jgi:hypothetical protein
MRNPLYRFLDRMQEFCLLNTQRRQQYLYDPFTSFIRNSPLTFMRTIGLIVGLMRKSTAIELFDFFAGLNQEAVTKSAFVQRRQLIKPQFIKDFFLHSAQQFYACFSHYHTFRGLRVFAVDGTGQRLPREPWIGQAFGYHLNQHDRVPSTRILATFDLLNKIIFRVDLHTQKSAEITHAYTNVAKLPKEAIYVYDRGFDGYGLPFLHRRYGSHFVIRVKKGLSPDIKDLVEGSDTERIINVVLKDRAYRSLRDLGLDPEWKAIFPVRLVKVILPSGEIEVLMTSLMDRKRFHYKRIVELYGWRWGVETAFHNLKSFLQLALVSAYTQPGVEQDLWATFWNYNINSVLEFSTEQQVQKAAKNRQYFYQINRNVAAGLIKRWMPIFFCSPKSKWRAKTKVLKEQICRHIEPYRLRPSRVRKRRLIRAQERHIYEPNYRSTL